ncbi:helix-turn-helix domain-containing protein [Xenophilus sp. Marseille-Q4582]|uniref:helix-turn-helix domain-containing protein n=1 Tax=Xenophilus sp. Marseille-Q4582 TaxID=2866600 RepID=UPI001CE43449|nr:helix-turn-helix domain-containing protein [Xenophilus sp. Marseille-Q4582]
MFRGPSPARLPPFDLMCNDLGLPDAQIARHLGVTTRTLRVWRRRGAPRAAQLALFWESRWGMSAIDAEHGNLVSHYFQAAGMHEREVKRLRLVVRRLEAERGTGREVAANSPFMVA